MHDLLRNLIDNADIVNKMMSSQVHGSLVEATYS